MHHSGRVGHRNRPAVFQGRSSKVYDFLARRVLRGVYRRLAADVADAAPAGGSVLDVGTGPGVLLVELARRRPDLRLAGVDLSPDMVTAAGRNLAEFGDRAAVRTGDVTDLPFEDGSFDLIVSSLSLHHWDDPAAAVPELARVLRPGGRVHIYDLRLAPFEEVSAAARDLPRFAGIAPRQAPIRTGVPPFRKLVRYVLAADH